MAVAPAQDQITLYLKRLSAGDASAESPLADAVYSRMRVIAKSIVGHDHVDSSLQATSLVNIVLLELLRLRSVDWQDREHFFRTAARMLRRRFVDYIRSRRAQKRPQSSERTDLNDWLLPTEERFDEILDIDRCLTELSEVDSDLANLVEMVYFGGCPLSTIAEIRGVSIKTVSRHLTLAQRWLRARFDCPALLTFSASPSRR